MERITYDKEIAMLTLNFELLDAVNPSTREVLVPENFSFAKLHTLTQLLYGMQDSHLHLFKSTDDVVQVFATFDKEGYDEAIYYQESAATSNLLEKPIDKTIWYEDELSIDEVIVPSQPFVYVYDFNDDWEIAITRGAIDENAKKTDSPVVLKTVGSDIIESIGGPVGLAHLQAVLDDPSNEEYDDYVAWLHDTEINVPTTWGLNNMIQQFFK
ncbi:plasmid pRiA4b ORF-3 family protein [Periweissella cryptocerci]|uniref:Plasmid pRiA4b ORF-3 family protein n=1 Tax=Periweissella cryptocerci TaxID=2506420 RepID=A0A4P6YWZ4_9LACO|nr:plasmid pRiA4b ORF-3 family protein [Periweissella cryptocerci]QBO37313.1 plasmid pRiA4b ORF-3 family protein [Periweissella cryptocerci]